MVNNNKNNLQDKQGKAPVGHTFVPTEMGSASFVALDAEGSSYKYETNETSQTPSELGPPWSVEPSLVFKCDEVGIDFDEFISQVKNNKSDEEIAQSFEVSPKTIKHLRKHFMTKGIGSTSEIVTG